MLLATVPGVVRDGKWSRTFEHDRNSALADLHGRWHILGSRLELFIGNTVGDHTALVRGTSRLELIRAPSILSVEKPHELRSDVTVVVGWSVRVRGNIPSRREYEKVREGGGGVSGTCCQDAEDTWIDMVHGYRAHVDKLGKIVFVRHLAVISIVMLSATRLRHLHSYRARQQHRRGCALGCCGRVCRQACR